MNEEEKQAIEILRNFEPDDLVECSIYIQAVEKITNLIDKQQKEIEKLKSRKYIFNAETNEIKEIPISDDYINKGKIKEKISILEKLQREFLSDDEHNIVEIKIIAYKELLGE